MRTASRAWLLRQAALMSYSCIRSLLVALAIASVVVGGAAASASSAGPSMANGVSASSIDGQASWPQFGRTAQHPNDAPGETGFTPGNVDDLSVAWSARFGEFASGQGGAAVANGIAYIGGSDGFLSAFSMEQCVAGNCAPLWRAKTHNGIYGTPAVAGNLVLVGSADRHLYAFWADGCGQPRCQPVWKGKLQDAALSSVAVADGMAYIGDFGGRIYAFSVRGCYEEVCLPEWTGSGGKNFEFNTTPAVAGGHVYIGALLNTPDLFSGRMFVFDADGCGSSTCAPEWSANLRGMSDGTLSPLVSGNLVYAGSGTRFGEQPNGPNHLFAFDAGGCGAQICKPLWSYATGDADLTGGLALSRGVIFAGSQSTPNPNTVGVFSAFEAGGCGAKVCQPLWTAINFASGFESPPVVAGRLVFVAKGPASGFPVDEAVLSYRTTGCGHRICRPVSFTQLGPEQFYLGSPIAIAEHTLLVPTEASNGGADDLMALQVG